MKKLKILKDIGVLKTNSELKALVKRFERAKRRLTEAEKVHAQAKTSYQELETDLSIEQGDLTLSYILQKETKHLRIAAEYGYLYAESELKQAVKSYFKKNKDNLTYFVGESLEQEKEKKNKKKNKKNSSKEKSVSKKKETVESESSESKKSKKKKKKEKAAQKPKKDIQVLTVPVNSIEREVFDPFVRTEEENRQKASAVLHLDKVEPKPKRSKEKGSSKATTEKKAAPKAATKPVAKPVSTPATTKPKAKPKPSTAKRPSKTVGFQIIEGVGPAAERNLKKAGFTDFQSIADTTPEELREKLVAISTRMAVLAFNSIPQQARLAAEGKWEALEELKKTLNKGR